jgi:hypothetical protein
LAATPREVANRRLLTVEEFGDLGNGQNVVLGWCRGHNFRPCVRTVTTNDAGSVIPFVGLMVFLPMSRMVIHEEQRE